MSLLALGPSRIKLGANTISLGGPEFEGFTVEVGGRWRAFVKLAQFAPDMPNGVWHGDRQVIGRLRVNTRAGTWRGNSISATWVKP